MSLLLPRRIQCSARVAKERRKKKHAAVWPIVLGSGYTGATPLIETRERRTLKKVLGIDIPNTHRSILCIDISVSLQQPAKPEEAEGTEKPAGTEDKSNTPPQTVVLEGAETASKICAGYSASELLLIARNAQPRAKQMQELGGSSIVTRATHKELSTLAGVVDNLAEVVARLIAKVG